MSTLALLYILLCLISTSTSYVYIPLDKTWDQARSYCLSDCKSHLASIHSLDDNNEAKALGTDAANAGIKDSIWIGLSNTESGSSSIYTWTDQSKFDFGNATDGNEPWLSYRPYGFANKCIAMVYSNSFLWKDRSCTGSSVEDPFICNECTYTDYNDLKTYYVSKLQFKLSQANTYCRNHCHSTIGSIHNEIDFQRIISLSQGTDVFIGLQRTTSLQSFSTWLDNTNLDWGRIEQNYPWQSDEPDSDHCVVMDASNIYQWKSTECDSDERFMCNSCDGVLNKYILIQTDLSWIDADNYCETQYGTKLASIHSLDTGHDWNEIITQMNISEIDSFWVGLHDVDNDGNYTWSDATFFDDTLSIFQSLPNGQCVYIDGARGTINYNNCNNSDRPFICAAPSEFEIQKNWHSERGIWEHRGQSFVPKNVVGVVGGGAYTLISDKQWVNKNGILSIEYMFSVTNIIGISNFKTAGLIIANFKDTICDFYYIAFRVEPEQTSLILVKNINGIVNTLQTKILEGATLNLMIPLKIIVTNNINFDIYLNDKLQFSFIDNNFNMNDPITSGYIGIHNYDLETISKWLYVSGAKWDINHENGYNKDFSICDVTPKTTTTTAEPINTTIAFITTESISTTKYYTTINPTQQTKAPTTSKPTNPTLTPTMKPTIKSAGDKTSIVPTLDDGSGVVNEQTKLTENDNNFNEELNKQNEEFILQLIIVGAIAILICGCIIILIYSLKKYKKKQKQAKIDEINNINMNVMNHTPVSTNAFHTLQLSSISKTEMSPQIIPMSTNSTMHVNIANINKNYMEIDMEGDTPRISTHRKSKTAEFKQMLGDNLYGNQLIMNDIVDDINNNNNENDNNNISNENEEHVTAGGPIINENDNDNNHEEGGQQQNDNEYGITKGGPNDDNDIILGNDEFIINGDSDDDNNQHITPVGMGDNEKSEENELITGPSTAGGDMHVTAGGQM